MCGLLGYFTTDFVIDRRTRNARLVVAEEALRHRGPNDRGMESFLITRQNGCLPSELILGHTRLSIIDLSPDGNQPMHSGDGRFTIVFNGEIYNYRELRQELQSSGYVFKTDSDTEVLVGVWLHWGLNGLSRLIGMFAFAVYDRKVQSLTMVRDAFGIKPFFYSKADRDFGFASEIPALIALLPSKPTLNWQRAYDYLVHGDYDSNSSTLFNEILSLSPGHFIELDLVTGVLSEQTRWWTPKIEERSNLSFSLATEMVRERFLDNMRLHLRSDVPLGAALSGGVDSSAVVCAMRQIRPNLPIHTFSFIASGSDVNEEYWVDTVNNYVGATSHKLSITSQDLIRDLDDMIVTQGEPFGSTSIYAQYCVFRLARQNGITVTLDGQGADEMLAGYIGYPGQRLRSLLETGNFKDAFEFLAGWSNWPGRSQILAVKYLAAELSSGSIYEALRKINGKNSLPRWVNADALMERGVSIRKPRQRPEFSKKGRRVIDELSLSLTRRGISSLLRHGDRNSMRFSIESRVPFLTIDFADLLLSMPEHFLISQKGETKHVFRAAMRGIVPDEILDRKDKVGFATDENDILLSMVDEIREWLSYDINIPFLNKTAILEEFEENLSKRKALPSQVWRWVNFIRWVKLFDVKID